MHQKKKVLFLITKATWGGAQRYVYDLATHLPREEFKTTLAYGERGRLQEQLDADAVEMCRIGALTRDMGIFSDVVSFFQILACIYRVRPDILHLNSSKAAALGALAARIMRVRRIVFTVHGWPFNEKRNAPARAIIYWISLLTALMSHTVIVVSKSDAQQGARMRAIGKKIEYIPIGIEPPEYMPRDDAMRLLTEKIPALRNAQNMPRIGTIAELTTNKGIRYAIEAIAALKARKVDVSYIVLGDGEERAHLKSRARTRDVTDRVFFAGFVENAASYLRAFDIFLLPSIKEGMPYVLLEAAAAGLPIVTTTVVNPEVVETYQHLQAIPPEDPSAIARALLESMRERTGVKPFPAKNRFSLSDMLERTIALYR